jgi:hypothetical protein
MSGPCCEDLITYWQVVDSREIDAKAQCLTASASEDMHGPTI